MGPDLPKVIVELTKRMLMIKASQEGATKNEALSEREYLILALLAEKGQVSVSQIAEANPTVSYSTISTDITRLWREKKMVNKTIDPDNQRVTLVELTEKGRQTAEHVKKLRDDRLATLYKALNTSPEEEEVMIRVISRASKYFDNLISKNGSGEPKE
jgi:DNA-binding MarR family transcriptional regulator